MNSPNSAESIKTETQRPSFVTEEHLAYLDELRESGATNMFGARPYLMAEFPELEEKQAADALLYWMRTFSARHREGGAA